MLNFTKASYRKAAGALTLLAILSCAQSYAQTPLTPAVLEPHAYRFTLDDQHNFSEEAHKQWQDWIDDHQYVGLAEIHRSSQLSHFTAALLPLLKENGFQHFALELGPNSADILNEYAEETFNVGDKIKAANQRYGKNDISKTPLIFVNKQGHALFMNRAAELGYTFWGLDQEYAFAFEMLFDRLIEITPNLSMEQASLYKDAKALISSNLYKKKVKGDPVYCWYQTQETLNKYLDSFKNDPKAHKLAQDIRESWDIYCRSASGEGSNQQRANYMKKNFTDYMSEAGDTARVFVKMGNVHLTHDLSPFGVDDLGKHLTGLADEDKGDYLSIRHLVAYRNGKSNVGDKDWQSVSLLLEAGRPDQWTVVDLRPLRQQLQDGTLTADRQITYELMNYDLLLISPDDPYDKPNY